MTTILFTIAVLGGLGLIFGLLLALASTVFAVQEDPRKELLNEVMPGANCGVCGFAGCSAYADAVIAGTTVIGACTVGGQEVAKKMAAIMGVADTGAVVRQVAFVRCSGSGSNRQLYQYEGIQDCLAASRLAAGGSLACQYGCLAFGTCVNVCDFGALSVTDGHAVVDMDKCAGCLKCVNICPRNLITVVPYGSEVHVQCYSKAKGAQTRVTCENGCIACGLCARNCPAGAITVQDNLATIDYDKCTSCGTCIEKCPQHIIRRASEIHEDNSPFLLPE